MIIKSYLDKCTTIIKDSELNTGLNPVAELNYGKNVSRILIHFPIQKIENLIKDGMCPNYSKFKHILHMTNAGSIDFSNLHCSMPSRISDTNKIRATSFDILYTILPQEFDNGKGWDESYNFFNEGYHSKYCDCTFSNDFKLTSTDGANWYQCRNGYKWENNVTTSSITSSFTDSVTLSITSSITGTISSSMTSSNTFTSTSSETYSFYGKTDDGVYSAERISKEYDKFSNINDKSNIIIGRQHFDIGNENIEIDITDLFNKYLNKELCNNGIMISYSPLLEMTNGINDNYVGFMTNKTNTFFEPFVESIYDDTILDDRANFIIDKKNRLYLYCNIGGNPTNLDKIPLCKIDDIEYNVIHQSKGVYYAEITLNKDVYSPNTMIYDTWEGIVYNGIKQDDVELYFTLKDNKTYFQIGNTLGNNTERYIPNISGIKSNEHINRSNDEIRKLIIDARVPYTKNTSALIDKIKIRLYVMDGMSELTVINWDNVNKSYLENYYYLRLGDLIPNEYHIDIAIDYNGEHIVHKNILYFTINNDKTNKYW